RYHSSLRPALQDRAHLQAGSAPDRFLHLPFLDVQHEAAAPQQRESASPSCLSRVPQRRQAQASRLPRLHPGRHHLPGTASVPCRCPSPARLELFRLLAANHSPRHPALRARRRHHATPEPPRISLECPQKLPLREIRHRTTGHQQNAGLPPRRLIPKFLANPRLASNELSCLCEKFLRLENSRCPNRQMRMAFEFKEEFDR